MCEDKLAVLMTRGDCRYSNRKRHGDDMFGRNNGTRKEFDNICTRRNVLFDVSYSFGWSIGVCSR